MLTYTQPINKNHHYTIPHYQCGVCCLRETERQTETEKKKKREKEFEREMI